MEKEEIEAAEVVALVDRRTKLSMNAAVVEEVITAAMWSKKKSDKIL